MNKNMIEWCQMFKAQHFTFKGVEHVFFSEQKILSNNLTAFLVKFEEKLQIFHIRKRNSPNFVLCENK